MASANVNDLIAQIIKGKEEQDAILIKLLQAFSEQKIADQQGQQIDADNLDQFDNLHQSDNLNQSENSSLSVVAEDFTQSTADIIESPESDGQSVLESNSPESCGYAQCPASMSPTVQAPKSPVSSDKIKSSNQISERSFLSSEQTYCNEKQSKVTSE